MIFQKYEIVQCAVAFATHENDLMPRFFRREDPGTLGILQQEGTLLDSFQWCLFGVDEAGKDWLLYHASNCEEVETVLQAIQTGVPESGPKEVKVVSALLPEQAAELRKKLLAGLKEAGVACVYLPFDGSGDEGYVEELELFSAAQAEREDAAEPELPDISNASCEALADSVSDFLEGLLLGWNGGSWGDNEGAFGRVKWYVDADKIEIDINTRYEASDRDRVQLE